MKKLCAILLVLCMLVSLAACGSEVHFQQPDSNSNHNNNQTEAMTQPTQQEETPDIISVVHPNFQLHDGFIEPVNGITDVPDGYIGISNASDFAKIGLNPDANYILMADIDMNGTEFDPISDFSGILEGNGYTVSNCEATIFSTVDGGTVRNMGVYADWKLEGTDDILENLHHQAGIARALKNGAELYNCWFDGSIQAQLGVIGGIACSVGWNSTIRSCYNSADISVNPEVAAGARLGGICVEMDENSSLINCFNEGSLRVESETDMEQYVGGIVGQVDINVSESGSVLRVYNCRNSGDIWCQGLAAGIIGWAGITEPYVTLTVEKCVNEYGTMFEGNYDEVAGILNVAKIEGGCIIVTNCCNRGVWCDFGLVGGDALQTRWDKISDDLMDVVIEYSYNWSNSFYGISKVCKNLNYCYYRDTCYYSATADGALFANVSALSQDAMKLESSYPGFDFETVWQMGEDWPEYRQTDY